MSSGVGEFLSHGSDPDVLSRVYLRSYNVVQEAIGYTMEAAAHDESMQRTPIVSQPVPSVVIPQQRSNVEHIVPLQANLIDTAPPVSLYEARLEEMVADKQAPRPGVVAYAAVDSQISLADDPSNYTAEGGPIDAMIADLIPGANLTTQENAEFTALTTAAETEKFDVMTTGAQREQNAELPVSDSLAQVRGKVADAFLQAPPYIDPRPEELRLAA